MVGVHDHQCPRLPPYYHFCPTDEQLIVSYLMIYVTGEPLRCDGVIRFADVYGTEPYNFLQSSLKSDNTAYFFSRRTNKGKQGCRTAGKGTWRLEKKIEIPDGAGEVVGYKGVFSFQFNCNERQSTCGWVMHEFVLGSKADDQANFKPQGLYRIRWKAPGSKQDEDEDEEDEVQEDDSAAAKRGRTAVEQENQEWAVLKRDGHNIGEDSMAEFERAEPLQQSSAEPSTDDWRSYGGYAFSEQPAYEEQLPGTVGSSMAFSVLERAAAVEYQSSNGLSWERSSYSVAVAATTGEHPTLIIGPSMATASPAPEATAGLEHQISDHVKGLPSKSDADPHKAAGMSEIPTVGIALDEAEAMGAPVEQCSEETTLLCTKEELPPSTGSVDDSSRVQEFEN